jgi:hypothetical protein
MNIGLFLFTKKESQADMLEDGVSTPPVDSTPSGSADGIHSAPAAVKVRRLSHKDLVAPPESQPQRQRWSSPMEFTITCIGYAVGLGNFWRFPYLCYLHGGGAFLVPYTLVLLVIGMPLFAMEVCELGS